MLVSLKHGIKQSAIGRAGFPSCCQTNSVKVLLLARKYIICIKVKSEWTVLAFYIDRLVSIEKTDSKYCTLKLNKQANVNH